MLSVVGRKARSGVWRLNRAAARLAKRLRYRRIVEYMHLSVCTPCQYDCDACSHQDIRYRFRNYHMSLEELRKLLECTHASGYVIERMHLTGPGEPLLWKHLGEGLRMLRASPVVGRIEVVSNGLDVDRLDEECWAAIDHMRFSLYPASAHVEPKLVDAQRKYGSEKVSIVHVDSFVDAATPAVTAPIPCRCDCPGPMYFDGKVFLFCGPPVFGAGRHAGVDVLDFPEMYHEMGADYLEATPRASVVGGRRLLGTIDPSNKIGNHELCRHCFANGNGKRPSRPHVPLRVVR